MNTPKTAIFFTLMTCSFLIACPSQAIADSRIISSLSSEIETSMNVDPIGLLVCHDTIDGGPMPSSGSIGMWAVDLVRVTFDTCGPLKFRIWYNRMDSLDYPDQSSNWTLPHDSMNGAEVLSSLPDEAIFYCNNMLCYEVNSYTVRIYAISQCGYWEFCESTVVIQDYDDVCHIDGPIRIVGNITNCMGEIVDGVDIELTGGYLNQVSRNQYTDEDGVYDFIVPPCYDWCVTADKEDANINGVSAQDLSLLLRHITGIEVLDNPYKKIASDLNGDRQIDIRDMLLLRKLLLGFIDELDDVESWVFIDAAFDFPGITDYSIPNYPTEICWMNVVDYILNANFIAVKIGDLEGSTIPDFSGNDETRSGLKTLKLLVENQTIKAGELVELSFTSDNLSDMMAFQGTLAFDPDALEFVDFQSEDVEVMINNQHANHGLIPFLWASATAKTLESKETLFTLKMRAKKAGQLKNFIRFSSTITEAIAFSESSQQYDLALEFVDKVANEVSFELFQNAPNPFDEQTTLRFSLPTPQVYQIGFYDVQGKYLTSIEGNGVRGVNEIKVNSSKFSSSSELIYYQLVTDNFIASSTMHVY